MDLNILRRNNDLGLLILRVSVAIMMLLHGIFKLCYGVGMIEQMIVASGLPTFIAYGVYIGEVVAPIFIFIGFRARLAAVVMAFNCVVATLMVHTGDVFSLGEQGGWALELLGLYFFGALTIVFTGAGKYALSARNMWD